jgi:hypothetical protein
MTDVRAGLNRGTAQIERNAIGFERNENPKGSLFRIK